MALPTPSADITCPVCHGTATCAFAGKMWQIKAHSREFSYAECQECRLLFCTPMPTPEETGVVYSSYYKYDWFLQRRFLKRVQARQRYRGMVGILQKHRVNNAASRLLDVGCGHGWFLQCAKQNGWEVHGLDVLDDEQVAAAQARGIEIQRSSIEDSAFPASHFDLITFWHSLEHTIDPRRALGKAASILKPGGLCVIALPNRDSKGLERAGVRWDWLQEPFVHLFCFSAAALRKIADGSLEPLVELSRDTWDQQCIMTTLPLRAIAAILRFMFLYPRKLFNRLRLERLARCCQWLHTVASESIHLTTYAGYIALRPLLTGYERGLHGSELVVIFRKKPSP